MDHFVRVLHVNEIQEDIQRAKLEAGEGEEGPVTLLLSLVREYHSEQEVVAAEGQSLAEEAEIITRLWAPSRGTLALAA
jgi:DNA primase